MYFKSLALTSFRNYENLSCDFHKKVNIITGENAQGKTNLIEALYYTSLGKSFRTFRDTELVSFDRNFCRIHSDYVKNNQENTIDFLIRKDAAEKKDLKEFKINGVKCTKHSELLENIYTVVFSPEDLKIVKDEPEKRRRFIDRELCMMDPVYYRCLGRYKKALLQRNELLKNPNPDIDVLSAWNSALVTEGTVVIRKRNAFIKRLCDVASGLHDSITQGRENLTLSYETEFENPDCADEEFYRKLERNLEHDLFRHTTSSGPHRDDLKIEIDSIDARKYGSQGQQRTAALSLKLAEIDLVKEETGEDAVLLLDDVLSELDPGRQAFLFRTLSDVQLFITCAERSASLLEKIPDYRLFIIEKGTIKETIDVGEE